MILLYKNLNDEIPEFLGKLGNRLIKITILKLILFEF